jgi:hypothetical protein
MIRVAVLTLGLLLGTGVQAAPVLSAVGAPDGVSAKSKGGKYVGGKGSSHKGGKYVSPKGKRYKK